MKAIEQPPQIGDRITDISAPPDEDSVRDWIGPPSSPGNELAGVVTSLSYETRRRRFH